MLVRTHGTAHARAERCSPQSRYARDGFPVSPIIAAQWANETAFLKRDSAAAATFLPGGRAPKAGEWFRNPDYARTLQAIADRRHRHVLRRRARPAHRRATRGAGRLRHARRPAQERAELGDADLGAVPGLSRVGAAAQQPGHRRARDAAHPRAVRPQGDGAQLGGVSASSHRGEEARVRGPRAVRRRRRPSRHARRAHAHRRVHRRAAQPSRPEERAQERVDPGPLRTQSETIYLAVADAEGNMVSFINSNYDYFGSGIVVPGTGFALHNRGASFTLDAGTAEHRRAGKAAVPHAHSRLRDAHR